MALDVVIGLLDLIGLVLAGVSLFLAYVHDIVLRERDSYGRFTPARRETDLRAAAVIAVAALVVSNVAFLSVVLVDIDFTPAVGFVAAFWALPASWLAVGLRLRRIQTLRWLAVISFAPPFLSNELWKWFAHLHYLMRAPGLGYPPALVDLAHFASLLVVADGTALAFILLDRIWRAAPTRAERIAGVIVAFIAFIINGFLTLLLMNVNL